MLVILEAVNAFERFEEVASGFVIFHWRRSAWLRAAHVLATKGDRASTHHEPGGPCVPSQRTAPLPPPPRAAPVGVLGGASRLRPCESSRPRPRWRHPTVPMGPPLMPPGLPRRRHRHRLQTYKRGRWVLGHGLAHRLTAPVSWRWPRARRRQRIELLACEGRVLDGPLPRRRRRPMAASARLAKRQEAEERRSPQRLQAIRGEAQQRQPTDEPWRREVRPLVPTPAVPPTTPWLRLPSRIPRAPRPRPPPH